ncbi:MAG: hypothetical protein MI741_07895, partial [Rhodospirillales bacterium]|nr:hypothetical protein [Rhodospirillales bacterium]
QICVICLFAACWPGLSAHADLIASYDFDPNVLSSMTADNNDSSQTNWTTSVLFDNATVDTDAQQTLSGGTTSADWTLYFSPSAVTNWTSLGTQAGAGVPTTVGPTGLTWDLSAIGTQSGAVDFLIDLVITSLTNGAISQRHVGIDNLRVNADLVPELALMGLGGVVLLWLGVGRRAA